MVKFRDNINTHLEVDHEKGNVNLEEVEQLC
jgi:hypothetical protein